MEVSWAFGSGIHAETACPGLTSRALLQEKSSCSQPNSKPFEYFCALINRSMAGQGRAMSMQTALLARSLLVAALVAGCWCHSPEIGKSKKRKEEKYLELKFSLHDRLLISDPSAFFVVPPLGGLPADVNGKSLFGAVVVIDDRLTVGPDPNSLEIGRAKGFYVSVSNNNSAPGLELVFTAVFNNVSGFPGSTISYRGFNAIFAPVRESAIVGGTGVFRLARGWADASLYSSSGLSGIDNFTSHIYYGGY